MLPIKALHCWGSLNYNLINPVERGGHDLNKETFLISKRQRDCQASYPKLIKVGRACAGMLRHMGGVEWILEICRKSRIALAALIFHLLSLSFTLTFTMWALADLLRSYNS